MVKSTFFIKKPYFEVGCNESVTFTENGYNRDPTLSVGGLYISPIGRVSFVFAGLRTFGRVPIPPGARSCLYRNRHKCSVLFQTFILSLNIKNPYISDVVYK